MDFSEGVQFGGDALGWGSDWDRERDRAWGYSWSAAGKGLQKESCPLVHLSRGFGSWANAQLTCRTETEPRDAAREGL